MWLYKGNKRTPCGDRNVNILVMTLYPSDLPGATCTIRGNWGMDTQHISLFFLRIACESTVITKQKV